MKTGISLSVSMKRFFNVVFCCLFLLVSCMDKTKMKTVSTPGNPYLPLWEHIPDGEPYVFEDPDNPGLHIICSRTTSLAAVTVTPAYYRAILTQLDRRSL